MSLFYLVPKTLNDVIPAQVGATNLLEAPNI